MARPRPAHFGERDAPAGAVGKADSRAVRLAADHHRKAPPDIGRDAGHRHGGEMRRPVPLGVDADNGAAPPAMAALVGDQPGAQRLVRSRLQSCIETGAHRQPSPVQNPFAIAGQQVAPDLLGEIGRSLLFRLLAMAKLQRLCFGLRRLRLGGCSVFDHSVQNPIAASFGSLREARRAVSVRRLRKPGEERGLAEGQFVERFVEIGERCSGHTVSARAEVDFVQV